MRLFSLTLTACLGLVLSAWAQTKDCPQCQQVQRPSSSFIMPRTVKLQASIEATVQPCRSGQCPQTVATPSVSPAPTGGTVIDEKDTQPNGVYWRLPDGRLSTVPVPGIHIGGSSAVPSAPVSAPQPVSSSAENLVSLHNAVRVARGILPLTLDPSLCVEAQKQVQYQLSIGAEAPVHTPENRLRFAENVGFSSERTATEVQAHNMWMRSDKGHREQILNSKYTRVGFASVVGPRGTYFAELFQ